MLLGDLTLETKIYLRMAGSLSESDRQRWDAKYFGKSVPELNPPDDWLRRHGLSLPAGKALDLACGLGHNAIWLAQQGWHVDAIDISPMGLSLAKQLAEQVHCPPLSWMAADLESLNPPASSYDLIIVFRFLDRTWLPRFIDAALCPGGTLIYETFTQGQLSRPDSHIKNSQFALHPNELPGLYPGLTVVAYEEVELPDRSVARLVARKPAS